MDLERNFIEITSELIFLFIDFVWQARHVSEPISLLTIFHLCNPQFDLLIINKISDLICL